MYFLYILFSVVLAASAQEYMQPLVIVETYPEWYVRQRVRRDVTLDKTIGDGRVFGTLGQNDNGLFGKGGYEHQIFNDGRGDLKAQAYGTHVLGPAGDSSHFGGTLNWKNPNAAASLDISKQIYGGTSYQATAGGRWPVGKNGDFSLQGTYGKQSGLPKEYGGLANFNYRWYSVSIAVFNGAGNGPFSIPIFQDTREGAPEEGPTSVECGGVTSSALRVSWQPTPVHRQAGALVGYFVLYAAQVPDAPAEIKLLVQSASSLLVSWKPPRSNGRLLHYTVYCKPTTSNDGPHIHRVEVERNPDVYEQTQSLELKSLAEGRQYDVLVSASTVVGEGQESRRVSNAPSLRDAVGSPSDFFDLNMLVIICSSVLLVMSPCIHLYIVKNTQSYSSYRHSMAEEVKSLDESVASHSEHKERYAHTPRIYTSPVHPRKSSKNEMFEISPYAEFALGFRTFDHVENQDLPSRLPTRPRFDTETSFQTRSESDDSDSTSKATVSGLPRRHRRTRHYR